MAGDTSDEFLQQLCSDLRLLRRQAGGPSLRTLSGRLGLGKSQVGAILNGDIRTLPDWDVVKGLVASFRRHAEEHGRMDAVSLRTNLDTFWRPRYAMLEQAVGRARRRLPGASSATASPAPPVVVPRQLPPAVRQFAGRAAELERLTSLVERADGAGGTIVVTAIDGMAGIGKTALTVHFAHRVRHLFPDGQLYVNLRGFDPGGTTMDPGEAIRGFLDVLGIPAERIPAGLHARAALLRSTLADRRVLVVLDNARDADQVRPLLPGSAGCLVLVTSRNRLTGLVAADGAYPVTLDVPSPSEARALLAGRLGAARTAAAPGAVDDLVTLCSRLPLALAIVAARAATRPDFPLTVVADELREAGGSLDALAGDDPSTDVRAVFSWSYRTLGPADARTFRLLCLHPGPDVTVEAAASLAGLPVPDVRAQLRELTDSNLLAEQRPGRYSYHDLLRSYAAELARGIDGEADRRAAAQRLLDHWVRTVHAADGLLNPHREQIPPLAVRPGVIVPDLGDRAAAMAWLAADHSALLAAVDLAATLAFDAHTWRLAWALTTYLQRSGHWDALASTQGAALRAAQRLGDRRFRAEAHRGLARACMQLGRTGAVAHLRQALRLYREVGDASGQARTHLNVAWVCERSGHVNIALDHAKRAVELFRGAGQRVGQADACNAVGWFYAHLGNQSQALNYCREALQLHQEIGDEDGEAHTWDSLGYVHVLLGEPDEAIRCYRRAVSLRRDLGDRYYAADALHRIGDIHHAAGDLASARAVWREALDTFAEFRHADAVVIRAKLDAPAAGNGRSHREIQQVTGSAADNPDDARDVGVLGSSLRS